MNRNGRRTRIISLLGQSSLDKVAVLFSFFVLFLLSSCRHHDEPYFPEPEQDCRQTVLVFMPWADNLQSSFSQNIEMIESAVVANDGLKGQRLLVFRSSSKYEASLVEILYGRGKCYHDTLKHYNSFRPMTVEGVERVVGDMRKYAPSADDRYSLLMGCHGTGWISVDNWNRAPRRVIGGRFADEQMNIDDFARAISQTGTKFELICFDDCYMAGIETAYELRNVTRWLVASTCEIMNYGLPYDKIFIPLTSAEGPQFETVMQSFNSFYSAYRWPYGTLSAIDCAELEATAEIMRTINLRFAFDADELNDIQILDGLSPTIFFDMGDYVNHLCKDGNLREQMAEQMQRLVPYSTHTPAFYSVYIQGSVDIKDYSGITISDPSLNIKATAGLQETAWWKATH